MTEKSCERCCCVSTDENPVVEVRGEQLCMACLETESK